MEGNFLLIFMRYYIDCLVETQNYCTSSPVFIDSSLRFSDEKLLFKTDLFDPPSFFRMFSLLLMKLIFFLFLFIYLK